MSERPDPRLRPPDPAGTRPRVDPESLLVQPPEPVVEGEAIEDDGAVEPGHALSPPPAPEPRLAAAAAGRELLPEPRAAAAAPSLPAASIPAGEAPHAPKFQFLLGALLALGVIAVVVAAGLARGGATQTINLTVGAGAWSAWQPQQGDPIAQIADHVGREYRFPDHRHRQMALVTGGVLSSAAKVVVTEADGSYTLLNGPNVLFKLCGLGPDCSLAEGHPSFPRGLLMRREALELALYSFRYVSGVSNVVVALPPVVGKKPYVTLFRRDALAPAVDRPLSATLAPRTPTVDDINRAPDTPAVKGLTNGVYNARVVQNTYLVLDPPTVASAPKTVRLPKLGG